MGPGAAGHLVSSGNPFCFVSRGLNRADGFHKQGLGIHAWK